MSIVNSIMPCALSISLVVTLFVMPSLLFEFSCALPSATTSRGTTWTNNIQSLGLVALPSDYIGSLTVRPILLTNKISYKAVNLQFGCGFFCYATPYHKGYLFATFFVIYRVDDPEPSDLQMVWVANREHLVEDNARLELTSSGNLVLKDADGSLVWSTNSSTQNFQGMRIEESGNLVLLNTSNGTLWQSYDYSTDMLLLGQKLKVGQKLIANNSPTNTSPGIFYGSMLLDGFAMFTATIPNQIYFRYLDPARNQTSFSYLDYFPVEFAYLQFNNESMNLYAQGSPSNAIAISVPIPQNCLYVKIDSYGHLKFYSFQQQIGKSVIGYLSDVVDELSICEYPRTCGDYGICTDGGQCSCPKIAKAFDQIDASKPNLGCLLHSPLVCQDTTTISNSPQGHQFLELEHVSYFTYFFENASTPELVSRDECKKFCLKNCSCKAAFFRYGGGGNVSSGRCYLESNVYSLNHNNNPSYEF